MKGELALSLVNDKRDKIAEETGNRKSRTNVLEIDENVSRETTAVAVSESADDGDIVELEHDQNPDGDVTSPGYRQLYRRFRSNKLSVCESAFNAAYLHCNNRYYQSNAEVKEKYKNIYAHPTMWYKNASSLWRHNKWSFVVGTLELVPSTGRFFNKCGQKLKGLKAKLKGLWRNFEYTHVAMRSLCRILLSTVLVAGAGVFAVFSVREIADASGLEPSLNVYVNGEYAGSVLSISEVETAQRAFDDSMSSALHRAYRSEADIKLVPGVANSASLANHAQLKAAFENAADDTMKYGYGLYVDGTLYGAAPNMNWITDAMNDSLEIKKSQLRESGIEVDNVTYYNNVESRPDMFPESLFLEIGEVRAIFGLDVVTNADKEKFSNTAGGWNPDGTQTAVSVGISEEIPQPSVGGQNIQSGNTVPGYVTDLENTPDVTGQQGQTEMSLDIVMVQTETVIEDVAYSVKRIEDTQLMEGKTVIETKGVKGKSQVVYSVEYVDGVELKRTEVSRTVISEPKQEVLRYGTRPMTEEEKRVASKGTYIWPCPESHRVSSTFGWRVWGNGSNEFHKGLDISRVGGSASTTFPFILACDGGEVIQAGDRGDGYGECVIILHDNGTKTRYAHCKEILEGVTVGKRVAQGDQIGIMGDTGAATGVHLHIEFIVNGVLVDPASYLPMP